MQPIVQWRRQSRQLFIGGGLGATSRISTDNIFHAFLPLHAKNVVSCSLVMGDFWFHFFKHNRCVIQYTILRSAVTGTIRLQAAFCAVSIAAIFSVGDF